MKNNKKNNLGTGARVQLSSNSLGKYRYSDDIKNGIAYNGRDNNLPQKYLSLLDDSSDGDSMSSTWHGIAVNAVVKYIQGDGLVLTQRNEDGDEISSLELPDANSYGESLNEVLEAVAYDYKIYGGASIEVIYTRESVAGVSSPQIAELHHVPFKDIRAQEKDYRGRIGGWYISNQWKKKRNAHLEKGSSEYLPVFNPNLVATRGEEGTAQPKQILVIKKYNPASEYYPEPDYKPALTDILIDSTTRDFKLNKIKSDISANLIIQFVGTYGQDEYKSLADDFADQWQGNENAGQPILLNAKSAAEAHQITTPGNAKGNAETYNSYVEDARQRILSAHGITFGEIVGIDDGQSLFGDEKAEKYVTFLNTTIRDLQMPILSGLNKLAPYFVGEYKFEINPIDILKGLNEDVQNVTDEEEDTTNIEQDGE